MTDPMVIERIFAWEAFDSRGTPTVACEVTLAGGGTGAATVPSGASVGRHEAVHLHDGGTRYRGRGVRRAVAKVNHVLGSRLRGVDASCTRNVDDAVRAVDASDGFREVGANAALSVSLAATLAAASGAGLPLYRWAAGDRPPLLPLPMVNILSGGAHAGGAVDVQDVLAVPVGADSVAQALEWCWHVRAATAELLAADGLPVALVADEGGLGPPLPSNRRALEFVARGVERAGLSLGDQVALAVDVAAVHFAAGDAYELAADGHRLSAEELVEELVTWADAVPLVSIEDPLGDDDWAGWAHATSRLGARAQLLGDDFFATNPQRLERAITEGVANAVLVKPNQAGNLTQARSVVEMARSAGYATVLSARSGDTEDSWLADLAVAWETGQIKVGSMTRSERTAKWNRLLRIEAEWAGRARFAGRQALTPRPR